MRKKPKTMTRREALKIVAKLENSLNHKKEGSCTIFGIHLSEGQYETSDITAIQSLLMARFDITKKELKEAAKKEKDPKGEWWYL